MRGGGPVAGRWGESAGDHRVEPALDGVELGGGFRGGVEAELLVEESRGAVASVALRVCPFLGGVDRCGGRDPLTVAPCGVFGGPGRQRGVVGSFGVAVRGPCGEDFWCEGDEFVGGEVVMVRHKRVGGWRRLRRCCW